MSISKKEAAERLTIVAAEMRLALDGTDEECPSWADDLVSIADALDPSGFVDERKATDAITRLNARLESVCASLNGWEAACRDQDVRIGLLLREVEGAEQIVDRANAAIARARVSGIDMGYTEWVAGVIADA